MRLEKPRGGGPQRFQLNALDRAMVAVHRALRDAGRPGWNCQCQVWFDGRLDGDRVRGGLDRLARRQPVVTARLHDGDECWEARPGTDCTLDEAFIDDAACFRAYADDLLAAGCDLGHHDPVRFVHARLGGGGDVLVVQWVHALMDRGWLLLQELDRLARGDPGSGTPLVSGQLAAHLDGVTVTARPHAGPAVDEVVRAAGAAGLAASATRTTRTVHVTVPPEQAAAVADRTRRACGFVNHVPGIAASILRAWKPHVGVDSQPLRVTVPLTLRPRSFHYPVFHNLTGHMQFAVPAAEVDEWEPLVRRLSSHMRTVVRRRVHLAFDAELELSPEAGMREFAAVLLGGTSSPLTYHGSVQAAGLTMLFGQRVAGMRMLASVLSPRFATLNVTRSAWGLDVAMPYDADHLTEADATARLSAVVADLGGNPATHVARSRCS